MNMRIVRGEGTALNTGAEEGSGFPTAVTDNAQEPNGLWWRARGEAHPYSPLTVFAIWIQVREGYGFSLSLSMYEPYEPSNKTHRNISLY